ncbi:peptidoglycan bridge formation glycyltransferase FemA/FemB family protein [Candidatus Wolfebacteria bacterium]|nr:peptidoglycan bridge formation glycyltransferase FemA/FemB family protein [Candidatus Wolfebacteria bacterium]
MEIKEITDKNEWENFLNQTRPHTFLQSWNWGEFNRAMSEKIWRIGIYNHETCSTKHEACLVGVALIVKISARRGKFLFVPHGPIFRKQESGIRNQELKTFVEHLEDLAQGESCAFIRISPLMIKNSENEKLFEDLGFRKAPMNMHATDLAWILNVNPGEEELLKNTRKTTRYLIRKAEKDGVEIVKSNAPADLEIFSKLYRETVERQRFVPYSNKFLQAEFEAFEKDDQISFFFAKYQGEIISGAMIIFYGDSAFYHQGASSLKYPKIPAPYLLQWEIIREVKKRGLKYYNFWGISPDDKPRHPWAGLSLFKKGFGGASEEYVPAQDLVLKKSYWITYLIETARKTRRGL